jgi:lysophospholipase L1-like esterase
LRFWLQTSLLILAALGLLEVLSRLVIGYPPRTRVDPRYGTLPLPHEPIVQSKEGYLRARANELGHLDAPMPTALPTNGILVIGDSFTEARQVALEDRFTDRLGVLLGRRVYNVGHEGWSPLNAIGFLTAERERFAPETVIVQVSGNDVTDIVQPGGPHVEERNGQLTSVIPVIEKRGLAKKITAVRETAQRSAVVSNFIVAGMNLMRGSGGGESLGLRGANAWCKEPTELATKALPWIMSELKRLHPNVYLLYLPQLDYAGGCIDRCDLPRTNMIGAAKGAGIPVIDVTHDVCTAFKATGQPLNGFANTIPGTGHYNAEGHAVIARAIAAKLPP